MLVKPLLISIFCSWLANCQQISEAETQCNGPPNFNCMCGASSEEPQAGRHHPTNVVQGRPGKIGPEGSRGPKGEKVNNL